MVNGPSARETKRLQTRERLMGAAVAEFKADLAQFQGLHDIADET